MSLACREAHPGQFPHFQESKRFVVKWGTQGAFNNEKAGQLLSEVD